MSNQEVVDFVHEKVAQGVHLDEVCEQMMDNCLADENETNGLGFDNMSVMIIGILNGKTEQEWYDSFKTEVKEEEKA
jgi:serine/threonine protein phosphatase PrpC